MEVQIESKPVPSSSPSQPSLFVKFLCCLDKGAHFPLLIQIEMNSRFDIWHTATSPRQCTTLKERLPLIITHAHDLSFVESVIRALRLNAHACTPALPPHPLSSTSPHLPHARVDRASVSALPSG
jgi:hypothetical protein